MDLPSLNEHVAKARTRAAELAAAILAGAVDVLEASREMHYLSREVGIDEPDPDFDAFTIVLSETDTLPIGKERRNWAQDALDRKEPEVRRAREWALATIRDQCRNIMRRFGAA